MKKIIQGMIFDIRRFSIHDGPGIRTTLFLKGCHLACWWCHNPESQSISKEMMLHETRCIRCGACLKQCPEGAIELIAGNYVTNRQICRQCGSCSSVCASGARELMGKEWTVDDVMVEIERDVPFFDESGGGVTISGGEPLVQVDFLRALLSECRKREIHTALDTCGYVDWKIIDSLKENIDLFLYDIKLIDSDQHRKYTGVANQKILDNLRRLSKNGARIILRVPIVPGITDSKENLSGIGRFVSELDGIERLDILAYHGAAEGKYQRMELPYKTRSIISPDDIKMKECATYLEGFGFQVHIGG